MSVSHTFSHVYPALSLSLILPLAPQMRGTVSFLDNPAPLRVRTHADPKAEPTGEKGSMQQMGRVEAAAAAAAPFYKGVGQGKTRPDSSHHPMGHSLNLEKNVTEER